MRAASGTESAVWRQSSPETSIGGPQTFTRREIAELPFRILGKKPRVVPVPASVFRLGAKMAGLSNPRLRELLEFVTAVSTTECRAPELGRRRLEDYFRTIA